MLCSGLTWRPSREPPSWSAKPWPEVTNHPRMPMSRKTAPRTRPTVRLTEVVVRVPADVAMGQTSGDERSRPRGYAAGVVYPRRIDLRPASGGVTQLLRRGDGRLIKRVLIAQKGGDMVLPNALFNCLPWGWHGDPATERSDAATEMLARRCHEVTPAIPNLGDGGSARRARPPCRDLPGTGGGRRRGRRSVRGVPVHS